MHHVSLHHRLAMNRITTYKAMDISCFSIFREHLHIQAFTHLYYTIFVFISLPRPIITLPLKMNTFKALLLGAAFTGFVTADFHLVMEDETIAAIPSNKYNCDSLDNQNLKKFGVTSFDIPTTPWTMKGSLCGAAALDFYPRPDGTVQAYTPNGDGSVVATCYHNDRKNSLKCTVFGHWSEKMVCYTYLCK